MTEERDFLDAPVKRPASLSTSDITPNCYEGGFKTWECSVDLATYVAASLLERNTIEGEHHIIEVLRTKPCHRSKLTNYCTTGGGRLGTANIDMVVLPSQALTAYMDCNLSVACRLQQISIGTFHCTKPTSHVVLCSRRGSSPAGR